MMMSNNGSTCWPTRSTRIPTKWRSTPCIATWRKVYCIVLWSNTVLRSCNASRICQTEARSDPRLMTWSQSRECASVIMDTLFGNNTVLYPWASGRVVRINWWGWFECTWRECALIKDGELIWTPWTPRMSWTSRTASKPKVNSFSLWLSSQVVLGSQSLAPFLLWRRWCIVLNSITWLLYKLELLCVDSLAAITWFDLDCLLDVQDIVCAALVFLVLSSRPFSPQLFFQLLYLTLLLFYFFAFSFIA